MSTLRLSREMPTDAGRAQEQTFSHRAAGDSAIVAVIGTSSLNVGMLQYRAREIIERIAANSSQIGALAAPVRPANGDSAKTSRSLPRRRPGSSS